MASSYIHRTNSGGSGTTATVSFWAKLNQVTADGGLIQFYTDNSNFMGIYANPTVKFRTYISTAYSSGDMVTYIKHRDPGAWYHYVCVFDTTNGVAADRMRLWINGVRVSASEMNSPVNPSSSYSFTPLVSGSFQINRYNGNTTYSDHDYSHIHYCDGYAYDASYFGEFDSTSGIWKIKTSPSVSYGTNGVFLKMEDRTNLDLDSSPNAHTMTTVGTPTATYDNPSNNFATLNPLTTVTGSPALTNSNTTVTGDGPTKFYFGSTLGMVAGKWYSEYKIHTTQASATIHLGISSNLNNNASNNKFPGEDTSSYSWGEFGSTWYNNSGTAQGTSFTAGDIVGIALDVDNSKLYFSKNGSWISIGGTTGDPTSGSSGTGALSINSADANNGNGFWHFAIGDNSGTYGGTNVINCNFGNGYFGTTTVASTNADDAGIGSFEYDVPTGYYALCTKNIKAYGG